MIPRTANTLIHTSTSTPTHGDFQFVHSTSFSVPTTNMTDHQQRPQPLVVKSGNRDTHGICQNPSGYWEYWENPWVSQCPEAHDIKTNGLKTITLFTAYADR